MIISYLCGGLGNQMFQYAAGRRLAHKHGAQFKLDVTEFSAGTDIRPKGLEEYRRPLKMRQLCASASDATLAEIARLRDPYSVRTTVARIVRSARKIKPGFLWPSSHVRQTQYRFEQRILDLEDNVYLDGFWQSWRYFDDIADLLRRELAPRDENIVRYAKQYVGRLRSESGSMPVVSLHVRRGDLATAHEHMKTPSIVHASPVGIEYIDAAMKRFGSDFHYLVFSDTPRDLEWCRQNIKATWLPPGRLHFSDGHSDIQDMAIMTACDHNIIANSTFSWWAAWLNLNSARRVVSPGVWSTRAARMTMVTDDLIPPGWEII
jgi:hypothetical protein